MAKLHPDYPLVVGTEGRDDYIGAHKDDRRGYGARHFWINRYGAPEALALDEVIQSRGDYRRIWPLIPKSIATQPGNTIEKFTALGWNGWVSAYVPYDDPRNPMTGGDTNAWPPSPEPWAQVTNAVDPGEAVAVDSSGVIVRDSTFWNQASEAQVADIAKQNELIVKQNAEILNLLRQIAGQ